jgi:hypothetical protein
LGQRAPAVVAFILAGASVIGTQFIKRGRKREGHSGGQRSGESAAKKG